MTVNIVYAQNVKVLALSLLQLYNLAKKCNDKKNIRGVVYFFW